MLPLKREDTLEWIKEKLGESQDIVIKEIDSGTFRGQIIYIKSLCDQKTIQDTILKPFYECSKDEYQSYVNSLPSKKLYESDKKALEAILEGAVVLFFGQQCYIIEAKKDSNSIIAEASVETVIQGPQNAFSEDIGTNINLIRHRYPQPSLRLNEKKIGSLSQTKVSIIYDSNLANADVVKDITDSLEEVELDVLQAAGQLHKKLTRKKRTLFPTMMVTERPDRVAYNLAQGKVVLLIDGTPFSLIAPAVFYDFMSSMEDVYQSFWISHFIVFLRYFGLFVCLLMPAFYVGITAYNTEFFRVQLALSIAGSRMGVPYPAFLEVLLMLLMMELLTEASIRLPKSIGSTATTVGGLILGQAAVEASLVSNVMIIIVAAVAISNFVIPINAMTFAMRVTKYIFLALTTFLGMVGLVIGVIGLIAYLANLESYGQPYLKLFFIPRSKGSKEGAGS